MGGMGMGMGGLGMPLMAGAGGLAGGLLLGDALGELRATFHPPPS